MIVVADASAVLEVLLGAGRSAQVEAWLFAPDAIPAAPELLTVEALQVLRRFVRAGTLSEERAGQALADLESLRIRYYGHGLLVPRIWRHRQALTAYDAAYVALAEGLDATLVTLDAALAAVAARYVPVAGR